jgi:hypothetical protein
MYIVLGVNNTVHSCAEFIEYRRESIEPSRADVPERRFKLHDCPPRAFRRLCVALCRHE